MIITKLIQVTCAFLCLFSFSLSLSLLPLIFLCDPSMLPPMQLVESPEQQASRQSPEKQTVSEQQLQQQQHEQPATAAVHASLLESLAAAVADQKHFQLLDLAAVAAAAAATASSGQSQNAGP